MVQTSNVHVFIWAAWTFAPKAWRWSSECSPVTSLRCEYVNISILCSLTQGVIVSSSPQSAVHMVARLLFIRGEETARSPAHVIHMPFHCMNFYPFPAVSVTQPLVSPPSYVFISISTPFNAPFCLIQVSLRFCSHSAFRSDCVVCVAVESIFIILTGSSFIKQSYSVSGQVFISCWEHDVPIRIMISDLVGTSGWSSFIKNCSCLFEKPKKGFILPVGDDVL